MINVDQLRDDVVRPTLVALDMWSDAAENLVVGTGAVESHYEYVRQLGSGPALGFWQMEPFTYDDIRHTYLAYRPELTDKILNVLGYEQLPEADRLITDMKLGVVMCRLKYRRDDQPLPAATDIPALADYWKRVYNSHLGAGETEHFVAAYEELHA